ncbi:hypothetical protein DFQ10_11120 [Winogradskyella eximia]|uniref:Dolichyl-phosphate-mannose-protein mannosyltransferase n=1 Tax=Winogradskyella eximia TaxID=262006 RepID=A0A3D9GPR8_9FLAO|nr:hypothetical protein [Winogradskyella eximia]RED38199.1 hypothetical protein DFQ10_11120 [Winogradskyella eximia]
MKVKYAYFFYVLLFFILALTALNFNYVEGDDASTILHHTLGRDSNLQPVYSPYHSMIDTMLSLVPSQNEGTLRYVSVIASFLSGFFVLFFLAYLLKDKFLKHEEHLTFFLFVLPFIIPDILFNSLLINPANISFALILLAHILFNKYLNSKRYLYLVLSVLLFGFGVSFRWNNGFYLFVLFGIYLLDINNNTKDLSILNQFKKSFLIFPLFIISVIGFIQISGYSIFDIIDVYKYGSSYLEESDYSLLAMAASAIPFITPAFLVLFILGIINCFIDKRFMPLLLLLIALIPYSLLGIYPFYKYLICILIPIVFIQFYGFLSIKRKVFKIIIACTIFLPWIFGLQLQSNSAWGPGFEIKIKNSNSGDLHSFNPDKSTKIEDVKIVFGSGMALPTPEGPRPLYGFGGVFLKDWSQFIESNSNEREKAVKYALENKCNILQDVDHAYIFTKLSEKNLQMQIPYSSTDKLYMRRKFTSKKDTVFVDVFNNKTELFNLETMAKYRQEGNCIIIYSSYSNIITKLKGVYLTKFEQQGAYWGILKK